MIDNQNDISDKQAVIEVLSRLPDNASLEDIRDEVDAILSVLESCRETDEGGETFSHAEVMGDIRQWLQKSAGRSAPGAK